MAVNRNSMLLLLTAGKTAHGFQQHIAVRIHAPLQIMAYIYYMVDKRTYVLYNDAVNWLRRCIYVDYKAGISAVSGHISVS